MREILARMRSLWGGRARVARGLEVGRMPAFLSTRSRSYRVSLHPILYGLSVLLTVACAAKPVAGQVAARVPEPLAGPRAEAVDQVRERIRQWMAERNLPGVSVAVGVDGDLVWAEGFGWTDIEQRVPVSPLTRFRIGSASKGLTSAAVGLLYERGALDLDAPVQTYVPSFPEKEWPISTRQLMGHLSGIRHYQGEEEIYSSRHYDTVLAALDIFAADPLLFRPGTQYGYSSYGWNLVGAVVESVAGEPFLDFMRREVFAPLRMGRTVPDDVFRIVPDRASFYVRDSDGRLQNERHVDGSNKWASGGFLSTPSDLVRFGFAMLDGELLSPQTVELLWTPLRLESGEAAESALGWGVAEMRGSRVVASPGSSIGGRTAFVIFPDQRVVIVVMSNVTGAEVPPVWQAVAGLFMGSGS